MKLRDFRIQTQPQLMVIPLIDIMFFLLVFFMMSTLYMVEQHILPVNLPQAATAKQNVQRAVNITVLPEGQVMVDEEKIPLALLEKRVQMEVSPERLFVVRADKAVEYGAVITVLDRMKQAGAQRVAVAAEREGR